MEIESNKLLTAENAQQCPSCGAYFTKAAKYCPHCGRKLYTEYVTEYLDTRSAHKGPAQTHMEGYLIHTAKNQKILIGQRTSLLIGSLRQSCDYCIENTAVSRIHAEIVRRDQNYYLKDLRSRNHTFLNGAELMSNEERLLKDGDVILFADEKFTFELK